MAICDRGDSYKNTAQDQYTPARGSSPLLPHNTLDYSRDKFYGGIPVIEVAQLTKADLKLYVMDKNREPVDLSTDSSSFSIKFKAKESWHSSKILVNFDCVIPASVEEQRKGIVTASITSKHTTYSGIMPAQLIVYHKISDDNLEPLWVTDYWFVVNPSVDYNKQRGAITIADVRLMLRDLNREGNILLQDFEFNDSEIVSCIYLPIDEFNEKYQPKTNYSPSTFPYRFHWLRATCGYLLEMAARGYARDHLPYAAGGIIVDDKNKAAVYLSLAQQLLQEWKEFVRLTKMEINISGAYGKLKSTYSRIRSR